MVEAAKQQAAVCWLVAGEEEGLNGGGGKSQKQAFQDLLSYKVVEKKSEIIALWL